MASYLHSDQLGSVRVMTGADGASDKEVTYRPYGEAVEFVTDPAALPETKGFIGERFDADAGLQYLNARYYDPKLGMFIQPDYAGYVNFYTLGPDTNRQLGSTTHWSTRHRLSALMYGTNPWKGLDPVTVHGSLNK